MKIFKYAIVYVLITFVLFLKLFTVVEKMCVRILYTSDDAFVLTNIILSPIFLREGFKNKKKD